jgi:hypothetical protein
MMTFFYLLFLVTVKCCWRQHKLYPFQDVDFAECDTGPSEVEVHLVSVCLQMDHVQFPYTQDETGQVSSMGT